jgi:hypothetical protein
MAIGNPVNQMHRTLRVLTEQDPTCQRAIAWTAQLIAKQGHDAIRNNPGLQAWIMENEHVLKPIADARRAAYQGGPKDGKMH